MNVTRDREHRQPPQRDGPFPFVANTMTHVYYEAFDEDDVYEIQYLLPVENETIKSFGLRVLKRDEYDAFGVVVFPSEKSSKAFVPGSSVASKFPDGTTKEAPFRVRLKNQGGQQQPNGKLSLFSLCFVLYSNDVPSNTKMKCYSVLIKTLLALQC
jgi:hypothetical protein